MANAETIKIEVVYALPERAHRVSLNVPPGTTIGQAINEAGILLQYPEINLDVNKVGIYGKIRETDSALKDGDRIEIYRQLKVDPKEARRKRGEK